MTRRLSLVGAGLIMASLAGTGVIAKTDRSMADQLFGDARNICDRDAGRLWGMSLCGPMMLVDYTDRSVLTNQSDAGGILVIDGPYFRGILPEDVIIANTATEWSGTRWTQVIAPLPTDTAKRHVLIAHELFHRIQAKLGLTRPETGNRHLDTLEGRYLLQLEWRALAAALTGRNRALRRMAINDALAFRHKRYALFADAAAEEHALEINEGVPEYTGVMLGLATAPERTAFAIRDLEAFVDAPTFVRSFAYATGPAYGLLLDEYSPDWKKKIGVERFDQLLATGSGAKPSPRRTIEQRAKAYDDGSLRTSEVKRDKQRRSRLADLKRRLVDGPRLLLPLVRSNYQFNPQTLIPLDPFGTVYPTMRLTDDWGALEVESGGALVGKDMHEASVSAPNQSSLLTGDGWSLKLKSGWKIEPGNRAGDYVLVCKACESENK